MTEYQTNNSIKHWSEEDRPREKLILKGSLTLSEAELIAILIGSGTRKVSAVDLARNILKSVNNDLAELSKLGIKELTKFHGIGEAKAISIISALELGKRRLNAKSIIKDKITTSNDAFEIFYPYLVDLKHEEFWILLLDRANQVIKKQKISAGGVSGTVADIKMIFKYAIDHLASSIILCHNHPSGNIKPSNNDISLTKKCKEAGKLLEIEVLDHIIIAGNEYYSFADNGFVPT